MNKIRAFFHNKSIEDTLFYLGWILLVPMILMGYMITEWIVPHNQNADCIVWKLFGVYCPGCGGTRAFVAFMHGHLLQSLWYHPLVIYSVALFLLFMGSHLLEKLHVSFIKGMQFKEWIFYSMLIIIGLNFIVKNVLKFGFGIVMI